MPLYQLILLFSLFAGFAAILSLPTLEGSEADLALLRISLQELDPWVVGLIGAAGLLAALVPGSVLLTVCATILSKNVYGALRPEASEETVGRLAKFLVPVVAFAALVFTITNVLDLVLLALLGVSYAGQLLPSFLFSLLANNPATKWGAGAGMLAGVAVMTYSTATEFSLRAAFPSLGALGDVNVGVVALLVNTVVLAVVSFATRPLKTKDRGTIPRASD
jgi:SSS family solute:Na+ symporter